MTTDCAINLEVLTIYKLYDQVILPDLFCNIGFHTLDEVIVLNLVKVKIDQNFEDSAPLKITSLKQELAFFSNHISQRIQWNEGAKLRKTNELHLTFRLTLSEPSMSSLPTPIIHEIQDGWPPYDLSFLFSKIAHEN